MDLQLPWQHQPQSHLGDCRQQPPCYSTGSGITTELTDWLPPSWPHPQTWTLDTEMWLGLQKQNNIVKCKSAESTQLIIFTQLWSITDFYWFTYFCSWNRISVSVYTSWPRLTSIQVKENKTCSKYSTQISSLTISSLKWVCIYQILGQTKSFILPETCHLGFVMFKIALDIPQEHQC